MSSLAALPQVTRPEVPVDAQSLEKLVLLCLESLANLAQTHGQRGRAARLLEAVRQLRQEPESGELTAREWEVARLVARGCSNRQIGQELIVSERTVDTHVSHILHKLGLASRAQIAAWVVGHQRRFKVVL